MKKPTLIFLILLLSIISFAQNTTRSKPVNQEDIEIVFGNSKYCEDFLTYPHSVFDFGYFDVENGDCIGIIFTNQIEHNLYNSIAETVSRIDISKEETLTLKLKIFSRKTISKPSKLVRSLSYSPDDTSFKSTKDLDCVDFTDATEAQTALVGGDLHRLDADNDGIACEWGVGLEATHKITDYKQIFKLSISGPEEDLRIPPPNRNRNSTNLNCSDFSNSSDAQNALADGDPHRLDADNDGIACEQGVGN